MPEDKNKLSDSDLFRQSIGEIKRIHTDKQIKPANKPSATQHNPLAKAAFTNTSQQQNHNHAFNHVEGNEAIFFAQPGVQKKTLKLLKRGAIHIEDELDLHGLTEIKAVQALHVFLVEQTQYSHHCAIIIHGKGHGSDKKYPVLKNMTAAELRNNPNVLAYSSALPRDGGVGAVYVLFKKQ